MKIFIVARGIVLNTTTSNDLDKQVQFLNDNPALSVEIQEHTDDIGSLAANVRLSEERAASVVRYLLKKASLKQGSIQRGTARTSLLPAMRQGRVERKTGVWR